MGSKMMTALFFCLTAMTFIWSIGALEPCPGDTRGDKRCNFDTTHRVCAAIGVPGTSFWEHTKQTSWCNTRGNYQGTFGKDLRCPLEKPTWCICKWATASWIRKQGCTESVKFNCEATDVCNLKRSFKDFNVDLKPAHDCMAVKCKEKWDSCPSCADEFARCDGWAQNGDCKNTRFKGWMERNCMKSCGKCTVENK